MLSNIIPLIATMSPLWDYVFYIILALAFVATVPVIIRYLIGR